ncbi:MAG: sialidase [Cyanothece sp. SIO1E1]|nr:sialidase [Cyanothece sp. SIO1E1]
MNDILFIFEVISVFLILLTALLLLDAKPALAHAPHDDVERVDISPNYNQDKSLSIIVRGSLLKSTNGGSSWQRIVRGLDNQYRLSSLSSFAQNSKIMFLSSLGDGIYKSEDQGDSWLKVNHGLANLTIDLIAVSPYCSDLTLAAGQAQGLYLTENRGGLWQQVIGDNHKLTAIAFFPNDQIVVSNQQGTLQISRDGGKVWQEHFTLKDKGAITAIAISPNFSADKTWFIGTAKGGVFKTVDHGTSFTAANKGLSEKAIRDIVVHAKEQKEFTLFVSTWNEGVFYSTDGGNTWHKKSVRGLTKDPQADDYKYQRPHFSDLKISNAFGKDQTIFLGGFDGLFKSTDGGRIWREHDTLSAKIITTVAISPNYKNDATVAIGTYKKGAYISHDRGVTWKPINRGLKIPRHKKNLSNPFVLEKPRFYSVVFSPDYSRDNTLFATLRYKFLKSNDGGHHWQSIPLSSVSGYSLREIIIVVSPSIAIDNTVYLGTYQGIIYRSTDAGSNFKVLGKVGGSIRSLVISPDFLSDQTLYAAGFKAVYKSVDQGTTWQSITSHPIFSDQKHLQLVISPHYKFDQTLIVGTEGGLFKTTDGGQNWVKLFIFADDDKESYITAIAMSPNYKNDHTFIVTVKGKGLFKTINNGETFTSLGERDLICQNHALMKVDNVPSTSMPIQFSPAYVADNTIYGYGSCGAKLFKSVDMGNTWEVIEVPLQEDKIEAMLTFARMINLVLKIYPQLRIVAILGFFVSIYLILAYFNLPGSLNF